jgi:hypothetical protein
MNLAGRAVHKNCEFEINSPRRLHRVLPRAACKKAAPNRHFSHIHYWLTIIRKDASLVGGSATRAKA